MRRVNDFADVDVIEFLESDGINRDNIVLHAKLFANDFADERAKVIVEDHHERDALSEALGEPGDNALRQIAKQRVARHTVPIDGEGDRLLTLNQIESLEAAG